MRNIVLLGAPGCGKGTQSAHLIKKCQYQHLSTGNIVRANIAAQTVYGKLCQQYSEQGKLVPDELMIQMVEEHLANLAADVNLVWDGFPRTLAQAEKLDQLLRKAHHQIEKVIYFVIDEDLLIPRLTGRLTCPVCNETYHQQFAPPQVEGHCDNDQSLLLQRVDDSYEKVVIRLKAYHQETEPLVEYYRQQNLLVTVNANQGEEQLWKDIQQVVGC